MTLIWRCGWCSRDRNGLHAEADERETTGICRSCLAHLRPSPWREFLRDALAALAVIAATVGLGAMAHWMLS